MSFEEIIASEDLLADSLKQKNKLDEKEGKRQEKLEFDFIATIDKKKFRYIAQIWKKLNDPNYISFVKNQLKKFSNWGLRYGTVPLISMYYNNISCTTPFYCKLYNGDFCKRVFDNFFKASYAPERVKCFYGQNADFYEYETGRYVYSSDKKEWKRITVGEILVHDIELVNEIRDFLTLRGITVSFNIGTSGKDNIFGELELKFRW